MNVLLVFLILKDKQLRDTTFVGIACLAVSDSLFLLLRILVPMETSVSFITCAKRHRIITTPYYTMRSSAWFAANAHVAFLAVIRFIILVYPLKSNVYLSPRRITVVSCSLWAVGIILIVTVALLIEYKYIQARSRDFVFILWTFVYIMPVIVTTVLHITKVYLVNKRTYEFASETHRKNVNRMSQMVIVVICLAVLLPIPRFVLKINDGLAAEHKISMSRSVKNHFEGISDLLFLINHSINPVIYGFLCPRLRKVFVSVCCQHRKQKMSQRSKAANPPSGSTTSTENGACGVNMRTCSATSPKDSKNELNGLDNKAFSGLENGTGSLAPVFTIQRDPRTSSSSLDTVISSYSSDGVSVV
ncbi:hypothetical protein DPMN_185324 [Dreissena polymorpha]|uniref:G-protein coupled receptors family 1 profile domain-containing protein n=1 Tax=Dreissena polymorpha TaxID=45954 RepID=A0A9D4I5G0_DREPO|nr:hypothetical protein DPMN_185324 [Dreissena polymorpha]